MTPISDDKERFSYLDTVRLDFFLKHLDLMKKFRLTHGAIPGKKKKFEISPDWLTTVPLPAVKLPETTKN